MEGLSQAGQQPRALLGPVPQGTVVTLHGRGIDRDPQWRHAGNELLALVTTQNYIAPQAAMCTIFEIRTVTWPWGIRRMMEQ
jgi:hypothetical protein